MGKENALLYHTVHGQIIIDTFGDQNLVKVDDPIVKSSRTGAKIELPHTGKVLSHHRPPPN